jgi:hypothetical protein
MQDFGTINQIVHVRGIWHEINGNRDKMVNIEMQRPHWPYSNSGIQL